MQLYNLDEITLIPAVTTDIKSRSECSPYTDIENSFVPVLPIFTSPMDSVIDETNYLTYTDHLINPIFPRTVPWDLRMKYMKLGYWVTIGLKEAKYLYEQWKNQLPDFVPFICIDQANGHMNDLLRLCLQLKLLFGNGNLFIMTGNAANPATYEEYGRCKIDYIRVAVGTGHGCTTSCQTGFHYPMGSLLIDMNKAKQDYMVAWGAQLKSGKYTLPKIIADGGINSTEQIIKALALGADFVMLGEMLAKSEEACGETDYVDHKLCRRYYGMSTEQAQKKIWEAMCPEVRGELNLKRAEGIGKYVPISYKLEDMLRNFQTDLCSAMSYANAKKLNEFIGKVRWGTISRDSYMKFMGKVL